MDQISVEEEDKYGYLVEERVGFFYVGILNRERLFDDMNTSSRYVVVAGRRRQSWWLCFSQAREARGLGSRLSARRNKLACAYAIYRPKRECPTHPQAGAQVRIVHIIVL
jgi:hypothetical protein